ncbi:hypothetical protein FKM82_007584 [Ascaphus truei]
MKNLVCTDLSAMLSFSKVPYLPAIIVPSPLSATQCPSSTGKRYSSDREPKLLQILKAVFTTPSPLMLRRSVASCDAKLPRRTLMFPLL